MLVCYIYRERERQVKSPRRAVNNAETKEQLTIIGSSFYNTSIKANVYGAGDKLAKQDQLVLF